MATQRQSMEVEEAVPGEQPQHKTKWRMLAVGSGMAAIAVVGLIMTLAGSVAGGAGGSGGMCARGHVRQPRMYGRTPEKTIWAYHYDEDCKSSEDCKLSDFLQLCKDTIEKKRGGFQFKLVHKDEVFDYITKMELPDDWENIHTQYQKDTVVNALLARYGGVALDLKTVMFHELDGWWEENMLDKNLVFKGFNYATRHEVATWFMMARREGLLRAATAAQSLMSGNDPSGCAETEKDNKLCYGSGMVALALCRHFPQFCKCHMDRTEQCELTQWDNFELVYEAKAYDVQDPRTTVQSPLLEGKQTGTTKVESWKLFNSIQDDGEAWQKFMSRYSKGASSMPFITLQSPGDALQKSKQELLADRHSFFYQWLCRADHPETVGVECGRGGGAATLTTKHEVSQQLGAMERNATPVWRARSLRHAGSFAKRDFAPTIFSSGCPAGAGRGVVSPPEFYGKVPERTIWAYHYAEDCRSSKDCHLSDFLALCKETIELKKGSFNFKMMHKDEVFQYITAMELPDQWESLSPQYQRDTVINALLARYGGVAIDLKTVMFYPLDHWWEEGMLSQNLAFKGFRYETRSEVATWFMMARREGLMRAAAMAQALQSGNDPIGCEEKEKEKQLCYGSGMVTLSLCRHSANYCKCYEDRSQGCDLQPWKELDSVYAAESYELMKPRDSVQSPLASGKLGVDDWKLLDDIEENGEGWEKFHSRYSRGAGTMPFVTLQSPGDAAKRSRPELLGNPNTFFYQWLCLAGHPETDGDACGAR